MIADQTFATLVAQRAQGVAEPHQNMNRLAAYVLQEFPGILCGAYGLLFVSTADFSSGHSEPVDGTCWSQL